LIGIFESQTEVEHSLSLRLRIPDRKTDPPIPINGLFQKVSQTRLFSFFLSASETGSIVGRLPPEVELCLPERDVTRMWRL
jgi:hypothetical protein